jgi:methylenetetrahydrofolate dehydrogenase (NADP+)/methenyltetrahydrofolate cyclohydrolase
MVLILTQRETTVSICHAKIRDLTEFTSMADVIAVGVGHPNFIAAPIMRKGAVVIDVGTNGRPGGTCDLNAVRTEASCRASIPGGLGP